MLWGRTKGSGVEVHSLYWGQRDMNVSCKRGKYYLPGEKVNLELCAMNHQETRSQVGSISWKKKAHGRPHEFHSWVLTGTPNRVHKGIRSRICHIQRAQSQFMVLPVKLEHSASLSPTPSSCSNSEENLVGTLGVAVAVEVIIARRN